MATHPSILAWEIPWTWYPGRLQPVESQRVGHSPAQPHVACIMASLCGFVAFPWLHACEVTAVMSDS